MERDEATLSYGVTAHKWIQALPVAHSGIQVFSSLWLILIKVCISSAEWRGMLLDRVDGWPWFIVVHRITCLREMNVKANERILHCTRKLRPTRGGSYSFIHESVDSVPRKTRDPGAMFLAKTRTLHPYYLLFFLFSFLLVSITKSRMLIECT